MVRRSVTLIYAKKLPQQRFSRKNITNDFIELYLGQCTLTKLSVVGPNEIKHTMAKVSCRLQFESKI